MASNMIGTRLILIRHGERNEPTPANDDPHLSPAGLSRARTLVHVLAQARIAVIYRSRFLRTREMAKPLATRLGIEPVEANEAVELKNHILANHSGKTVLVIGHSNTVPELINLLGNQNLQEIPDDEFDNMFIVTILGPDKVAVIRLKYGEPS